MKFDKSVLIIGGVGLIALVAIMRSSGNNNAGYAATAASIGNSSAINVRYSEIAAQRDAAANDAATARLGIVADVFKTQTGNSNSIAVQALASAQNTAQAAMLVGAQVTDSYISSDLAKALGAMQVDMTKDSNATELGIAQSADDAAKQQSRDTRKATTAVAKYGLAKQMSSDAQKTISSIYGH